MPDGLPISWRTVAASRSTAARADLRQVQAVARVYQKRGAVHGAEEALRELWTVSMTAAPARTPDSRAFNVGVPWRHGYIRSSDIGNLPIESGQFMTLGFRRLGQVDQLGWNE